jgi:hypothetical protein
VWVEVTDFEGKSVKDGPRSEQLFQTHASFLFVGAFDVKQHWDFQGRQTPSV